MDVSRLIRAAFEQAAQKYPDLHQRWIQVSFRVLPLLPDSLLWISIQSQGSLDIVLRSMEDEAVTRLQAGAGDIHYQKMLSELWVGSVYEMLRLLGDPKRKLSISDEFRTLAHDFRLLRIPLEKYEITSDRELERPLQMQRHPPNNNETDIYEYDKSDPQRAHIMPSGVSQRGSVMWQVLDLRANEERWVERRELSDRFLSILERAPPVAAPLPTS